MCQEELEYIWLYSFFPFVCFCFFFFWINGFIHCLKRNKITTKRVENLLFVYSNLRLLSRSREYTKGKSQKWNIGGDSWDESFGGPRLLETAFLSLDESELEVMLVEIDEDSVEEENVVVMLSS